ncbi:MAG: AGE family epimerase/isomerase [Bacillus subtilis]|nr:AGE family epimerase/isomerase [Bacillus subtilis]
MKDQIQEHIKSVILPFWTALFDVEYGGFYGHVDGNHVVHRHTPKGLVQQTRHLYAFSRLYRTYGLESLRPIIDQTFAFIQKAFYEPAAGAYGWMASREGKLIDSRIVTYGQAFVLYGFSEYYLATNHPEALASAMALYRHLENHHYNPATGGYIEEFDPAMKPKSADLLADGVPGVVYTANTHLHLLEAIHQLLRATGHPAVKKTLHNLIHILRDRHYDEAGAKIIMYCDAAFAPIASADSFGHDIETAWLLDDAAMAVGLPKEDYRKMTQALAEHVLQCGFNGRYVDYEAHPTFHDKNQVWWVQCEAMIGFADAYRQTKDERYLSAVQTVFHSVMTDLVDKTPGSEWFWSVSETGVPSRHRGIAEIWKTTYHNVRALLELIERL